MKRLLPFLLAIILMLVMLSGCNFRIMYNDYDYGDEVWINVEETLYKNKAEWVRLDSVTTIVLESVDTLTYAHFTTFTENEEIGFSVRESRSYEFYTDYSLEDGEYAYLFCKRIETSRVKFIINVASHGGYVEKPNIYLYPKKKDKMTVSLGFPKGGKVVKSIPDYPKKWKNIKVKPNGKINGKYRFLFYEADVPDNWQYEHGWVIAKKELMGFLKNNLKGFGFNQQEVADFIEYWIPRLNSTPFYAIYPQQNKEIDQLITLKIDQTPDAILRLYYIFEPLQSHQQLKEPTIPTFKRKGFTVTEWGGILK